MKGGLLVGPRGLEPRTSSLSGMRSNRAELWAPDDDGHRGVASLSVPLFEVKLESADVPGLEDSYCAVDQSCYFL